MLEVQPGRPAAPPTHAATVMLLRDRPEGGFEVFMVRRHSKSGFMGGAYVFPGGKLDDGDADARLLGRCEGLDRDAAARALGERDDPKRALALYVAAVRETFEEAGVLIADVPTAVDLREGRERIMGPMSFAEWVDAVDARLRVDRMVPWARWVTPAVEPRRYDTRFFVTLVPPDELAEHDRHETTEAAWMTPEMALTRDLSGEIQLPPPTLRNLEILSGFQSAEDVLAAGRRVLPPFVDPVFVDDDGTFVLALPGDPDHPSPEAVIPGPTRFVLSGGRWWSGAPR